MRTSRGASVGVVTELVNVESPLSVGVVARDVPGDSRRARLALLLESHGTRDLGVTTKDSHCENPSQSDRLQGAQMCSIPLSKVLSMGDCQGPWIGLWIPTYQP